MTTLRPELAALVDALLADKRPGDAIDLDEVGDVIGARAISQDEIDAMLDLVESRGHRVASADGGRGEAHLKAVLEAARVLRTELGRAPQRAEIAARAGLTAGEVEHALALARVIQR